MQTRALEEAVALARLDAQVHGLAVAINRDRHFDHQNPLSVVLRCERGAPRRISGRCVRSILSVPYSCFPQSCEAHARIAAAPARLVVRGRARFRWGDRLEFVDEAGPGDFVYVPPYVPHQELNARKDEPVEAVIVRSGQEPVVVNLDIPSPEENPATPQPDPFHSAPGKF